MLCVALTIIPTAWLPSLSELAPLGTAGVTASMSVAALVRFRLHLRAHSQLTAPFCFNFCADWLALIPIVWLPSLSALAPLGAASVMACMSVAGLVRCYDMKMFSIIACTARGHFSSVAPPRFAGTATRFE